MLAAADRPASPPTLERRGIRLDPHRRTVTREGIPVPLSRNEFAVLAELLLADGGVVSAEHLLEKAWDEHIDPFTAVVKNGYIFVITVVPPTGNTSASYSLTADPQSAELKRALELRAELGKLDAQINANELEQQELNQGLDETRQNLKAIEKLASAKDLRTRLFERLKQLDARGGQLTQQLIEARTKHAELEVRLSEALDHVTLERKAP